MNKWLATRLNRRELLALLLFKLVPLRLVAAPADMPLPDTAAPLTVEPILRQFIDLLIPADSFSPAASALQVDRQLLQLVSTDPLYARFVSAGCAWLTRQAGGDYLSLSDEQHQQLLEWMDAAPARSFPQRFFNRIRHDAMSHYYSQPESWKGLGITQPPQPRGYPDYPERHG